LLNLLTHYFSSLSSAAGHKREKEMRRMGQFLLFPPFRRTSGSAGRLSEWLGVPVADRLDGVQLQLIAPNGHPGITQVTFESPEKGTVVI